MHVVHVITGLYTGGAEMMLHRLVSAPTPGMRSSVISLTGAGTLGPEIERRGVPIYPLGMNKSWTDMRKFRQLPGLLKRIAADLVQTWLYHSDLAGGLSAQRARIPVVWNVRQSNLDRSLNKTTTLVLARICAVLSSRVPDAVIFCGEEARRRHEQIGYRNPRHIVIPNGIDLQKFYPSEDRRARVRHELGLDSNHLLVGLVGRYHPQKGHNDFLAVAARLAQAHPKSRVVLAGLGLDNSNTVLATEVEQLGLRRRVCMLGERVDIPEIMAALDLYVSTSLGEGWPNVIGEAMASEVPCVATDAGDSARVVGDTGVVVRPGDVAGCTAACSKLLGQSPDERKILGKKARRRIRELYDIRDIVVRYRELYRDLAAGHPN